MKKIRNKVRSTGKKVEVKDGTKLIVRSVYRDMIGEFFKHDNKKCYIYQQANGRYNSTYYNGVRYI